MSGELRGGIDCVVADEEASGHGEPSVAHYVGITEEAGEAVPVWEFEFAFRAVDDGFTKRYGKTDGGVEDLVVVGVVVDVAAEIVSIETELVEKAFGGAEFEVVAVGRLNREAQDIRVE